MPDTEASIFEEPGAKKRHAGIGAGAVRATGRPTAMAASRIALARSTIPIMSIKEIEAAVLKLVPKDRARLAGKLLESLEDLSEEENEIIWAQEAERRDAAWNSSSERSRSAKNVLRRARAKLR